MRRLKYPKGWNEEDRPKSYSKARYKKARTRFVNALWGKMQKSTNRKCSECSVNGSR